MSVFVFVGPTLRVEEARPLLDATYLPPVKMGSILGLVGERPRAIVIIDGVFEQTPAVWHKEILFALSKGIRVFGASSMGALRAAELAPFGMEGLGRIFAMFHDGTLEDDDEVAVAHASAEQSYRCLSDAMVNIRHGLEEAEAAGAISPATRGILTAAAKARFYSERSWPDLLQPRADVPDDELTRLREHVRSTRPDLKRSDAVLALRHVASADLSPHTPRFDFVRTDLWDRLVDRESRSAGMSVAAISSAVRAAHPERVEILRGATRLLALSASLRRATGRDTTELADLDGAADGIWRHHPGVDRFVPAELVRRGLPVPTSANEAPVTEAERDAALAWYAATHGEVPEDDRDAHATALRFHSWPALIDEVARARRS